MPRDGYSADISRSSVMAMSALRFSGSDEKPATAATVPAEAAARKWRRESGVGMVISPAAASNGIDRAVLAVSARHLGQLVFGCAGLHIPPVFVDRGVDVLVSDKREQPHLFDRHRGRHDLPRIDEREKRLRPLLAAEEHFTGPRLQR